MTRLAAALVVLFCVILTPALSTSYANNVLPPLGHTLFCQHYPNDCQAKKADVAEARLASAERWRELNNINSSVNTSIAPVERDGIEDGWDILPSKGNCTDYAVTKRHFLLQLGWPSSSLLLAEVVVRSTAEHHLILIVKGERNDWVLDNLKSDIAPLTVALNDYDLKRAESSSDPRSWTAPSVSSATD